MRIKVGKLLRPQERSNVILNDHNIARLERSVETTGSTCEYHRLNAEQLEHFHRHRAQCVRVAFVGVESTLHAYHRRFIKQAED